MAKQSPFDYAKSICEKKQNEVLSGTLTPDDYNPFMVNRVLSLYPDTVLLAQEMNTRPSIPKDYQFHFLHGLVDKRKRWAKWPKKTKEDMELLSAIIEVMKVSEMKAEEIIPVLTDKQKQEIIDSTYKGGRVK